MRRNEGSNIGLYVKGVRNNRMENSGFQSSQVNKFSRAYRVAIYRPGIEAGGPDTA